MNETTTLYRLFDRSGRLLYIGITKRRVGARIASHRRKPWGAQIHHHLEETILGPRTIALRAEAAAISAERPAHNLYQTEAAPVRGQRSAYGRCPVCKSTRSLRKNARLKQHWSANEPCAGSGAIPEPLTNPSEDFREELGNREQGTEESKSNLCVSHQGDPIDSDWTWS